MVFVNPSNNHWRLIVIDGVRRQVVLFDPMGAHLPANLVDCSCDTFVGPSYRSRRRAESSPAGRELELWGVGALHGVSVHRRRGELIWRPRRKQPLRTEVPPSS